MIIIITKKVKKRKKPTSQQPKGLGLKNEIFNLMYYLSTRVTAEYANSIPIDHIGYVFCDVQT